jgi:uncharacterized protein YciI
LSSLLTADRRYLEDCMAQFLIIARDGTDPDALGRRMAARPAHFAGIEDMVAKGEIISGGALLDDAGKMTGSYVIAECASRDKLDAWFAREPYVQQGVWRQIDVTPIRIAVRDGKIVP